MTALVGKVALVTGGSRGIGAGDGQVAGDGGCRRRFHLQDELGRRPQRVPGGDAARPAMLAVQADSSDADKLAKTIDGIARELGRLDIFVSSAGALLFKPIDAFTLRDFEEIVALDLRAAFVGAKAALAHLPEGGRIIVHLQQHRRLCRAAHDGLLRHGQGGPGRPVQGHGARPRTARHHRELCPSGPIDTDANPENGQYSADLKRLMATPRFGKPQDVGALVAFLASPQAGFVSGTVHHVDNGFTA